MTCPVLDTGGKDASATPIDIATVIGYNIVRR